MLTFNGVNYSLFLRSMANGNETAIHRCLMWMPATDSPTVRDGLRQRSFDWVGCIPEENVEVLKSFGQER